MSGWGGGGDCMYFLNYSSVHLTLLWLGTGAVYMFCAKIRMGLCSVRLGKALLLFGSGRLLTLEASVNPLPQA